MPSIATRFVGQLSLVAIAAFRPDDIEGALAYLAETAAGVEPATLRAALDALKTEVST